MNPQAPRRRPLLAAWTRVRHAVAPAAAACAAVALLTALTAAPASASITEAVMVVNGTPLALMSVAFDNSPPGATVTADVTAASKALLQYGQTGARFDADIYVSNAGQGTDVLLTSALVTSFSIAGTTGIPVVTVAMIAESVRTVCTGAGDSCAPAGLPALQLASSPSPATAGSTVTFTATEPGLQGAPDPTGTVSFTADSTALPGCTDVTLASSQATCATSALTAGSRVITAQYSGDSSYLASAATVTVNVITIPGAPTGLAATAGAGQVTLSWAAPASDGGSPFTGYHIYQGTSPGGESATPVNSSPVTATSMTVTGLAGGTTYYFVVTAVNAAGEGPPSAEASATPILIPQAITFTSAPPSPAVYGGNYSPAATGGGSGHPVTFGIDSASSAGACTVSSSGTVSFSGTGLCVIDANQAGGSGYAAAPQVQQSFAITPATLTVTAGSASRLFGAANPALTFTITGFVNGDTPGVVSGTPACTTTAGPSSPGGTYPVTCAQGSLAAANYALAFTPGVLTVTYTGGSCLTGSQSGPLTVRNSQAVCLGPGYQQDGPVTVQTGGALDIEGAQLAGPLAADSAAAVRICLGSISGPVRVTASTGLVLIGDAGDAVTGCGASTISGPVTLSGNLAGAQLGGNIIHGPVSLTGNSGGTSPDTAVPQVAANHISGPLACSGNTPAPTDDHQPNTVSGPASGQCAGLACPRYFRLPGYDSARRAEASSCPSQRSYSSAAHPRPPMSMLCVRALAAPARCPARPAAKTLSPRR